MTEPALISKPEVVSQNGGHERVQQIREAQFGDHTQITALQVRNGLQPEPYDKWVALWKNNPVYRRRHSHWPIGWVLETEAGEIVGTIGNIPLAYHFRGRELLATSPYSWVVDPPYRRHTLRLLQRLLSQADIDLIVCATVGPASEPMWRLFQSKVPVGTWDKSAFWITQYRHFVKCALQTKSVPLAELLSYPIAFALFCRDKIRRPQMRGPSPPVKIEECADFDKRFDEFWQELKEGGRELLLAERTQATLAWHFRSALAQQGIRIVTVSEGQHMVAYTILEKRDRPDVGLRRLRLVDFQVLKGFEGTLQPLLQWVMNRCRKEGVHALENFGCWLERPGLPRIDIPYRRSLGSWFYYYKALDSDLGNELANPMVWAPSAFDGDASL